MTDYSAASIRVLKALEPVKERPGMYTRTTCPTHIVQEVIDNAADEALAGFAKRIAVRIAAGGLHGVGVSVTNALSTLLEVEIKRGGGVHRIAFSEGFVTEPLTRIGEVGPRTSGTTVRIRPNGKYFDSPKVNLAQLEHLLRSKAVLMPNVTVELEIEGQEKKTWCYQNGKIGYLAEMMVGTPVAPIFVGEK